MKGLASSEIRKSMQEIFQTYSSLRDKKCAEKTPFWDAVVLTTFDEAQRRCFVEQVERKRKGGQLPQVPIYVVSDPIGQKLGVGGSTLHVLSELSAEFGVQIYNKKLLIIHSGGSSQRLPSYSVLGKIFAPVPVEGLCVGSAVPQMLDLKLALYLPLCRLLGPGTLVTCADDIETYCLDPTLLDTENLSRADVVALGHPSSLQIGTGHGVYVLGGAGGEVALNGGCSVQECLEVLQKPTISAMRESGAVFRRGSEEMEGEVEEREEVEEEEEEEVWSDSVFWLSSRVCRRLLKWYTDNRPLSTELDAYTHILPCLGVRMEAAKVEDYTDFRCEMLPLVRGASFKVITLPQSTFYHLGTMEEYVENFNTAEDFITELGINRNTSNLRKVCVEALGKEGKEGEDTITPQGTIIESYFLSRDIKLKLPKITTRYVIEHCRVGVTLRLDGDAILSNCSLVSTPTVPLPPGTVVGIPGGTLFHTVPILHEGRTLYVTVAFDLDAPMKVKTNQLKDVRIFGRTLKDVVDTLGLTEEEVKEGRGVVSLWDVPIFASAKTASESFWLTHDIVCRVKGEGEGVLGVRGEGVGVVGGKGEGDRIGCEGRRRLFSMKDVVGLKDLNTLLEDRKCLVESVASG